MSGAALDMTLDDLIKSNKKSGSRSRGRGSSSGPGPNRRFSERSANRAAPYTTNRAAPYTTVKAPESTWGHDMFAASGARATNIETGTKLLISNLDYSVSSDDIKELFSEVGDMKRYNVQYDRSGRSKGTAEVVFTRKQDALDAVKRYNNVQLDGKPMKIEIVGTNLATAGAGAGAGAGASDDANVVPGSGQRRGGGFRSSRRGGGGRGRGRGRARKQGEKVSAEELDADLDQYHADAMQTN